MDLSDSAKEVYHFDLEFTSERTDDCLQKLFIFLPISCAFGERKITSYLLSDWGGFVSQSVNELMS
jgi:hypothetical protein